MKTTRFCMMTMVMVLTAMTGIMPVSAHAAGRDTTGAQALQVVDFSGNLVQEKIYRYGDGIFELNLELRAAATGPREPLTEHRVDIVLVLDRSGSMQGRKLSDAVRAANNLIGLLSQEDRLSLVSYADDVRRHAPLMFLTTQNRSVLRQMVHDIYAGGATNLGGGLRTGLDTILSEPAGTRIRKVILISDGLANRGIVDPLALGRMASIALEENFSVATVGVGDSFNEQLMAHIADQGAGTYHYLENPDAFAAVFEHEFMSARHVAATGLEIHIPKVPGVRLLSAGGFSFKEYPGHYAVYPGDLLSGRSRKVFLRFQASPVLENAYKLEGIWISYVSKGTFFREPLKKALTVTCTGDRAAALSSIHRQTWEDKVIQEDYNRLREAVAADVKAGAEKEALSKIETYYKEKKRLNQSVQSERVEQNLEEEVDGLKSMVRETFLGAPAAVRQKQKTNAKSLQYEGYKERRSKE
ncbi:MAG: VWA domain-containing protein [Deltaproteobacteria bacterium]|nr:VWA domain-containing protein [Deltaproteobacteria bacterium]